MENATAALTVSMLADSKVASSDLLMENPLAALLAERLVEMRVKKMAVWKASQKVEMMVLMMADYLENVWVDRKDDVSVAMRVDM